MRFLCQRKTGLVLNKVKGLKNPIILETLSPFIENPQLNAPDFHAPYTP